MGIFKKFAVQFEKPKGFLGSIAGRLMAATGVEKNKWTISLLNLQRTDNVLEIGFGPGVAAELAAKRMDDGRYVGIDYSEVMLRQAAKRNKKAIQAGKANTSIHETGWSDYHNDSTLHERGNRRNREKTGE